MSDVSWRDVRCTTCGAVPHQKCFLASGKPSPEPHAERKRAAREAAMPTPVLGYPRAGALPHVVSLADPAQAICGTVLEFIPEIQPPLHTADPKCRNLLGKVPYRRAIAATGVCPVCVSEEDLDDDGLIVGHRQLRGFTRTDVDCGGRGMKPDGDS